MMRESLHCGVKNSSKLALLQLRSKTSNPAIVGFYFLHILLYVITAVGDREIKPINLYQRIKNISETSLQHETGLHARSSLVSKIPSDKIANGDDSKDPVGRLPGSLPTLEVRNRRMFDHQDAPEVRFDGANYGAGEAGVMQLPEFPGAAYFNDDMEQKNPWINTDDYNIMIALRWTDSDDYEDAVLPPVH